MQRRAITYRESLGNNKYTFHLACGHKLTKQYKVGAQIPWKTLTCPECK